MSKESDIVIAGTGAMACLFGARLAPFAKVVLLGTWPEGLDALRRNGIRLVEMDGTEKAYPVTATNDPAICAGVGCALVLVKSWQTERAARQLEACLDSDGIALTLQNGLGNLEILQGALGEERSALGVTTMGATLLGPSRARVGGEGKTYLGSHPRLHRVTSLLEMAGFETEIVEDLKGHVWGKLAINAGINPLTALLGVPNGRLVEIPDAEYLMKAAAEEVAAVAAAGGIRFPYEDAGAITARVAARTASNRSSMLQDVERGAPTEIEAINGAVVREGERLGVPTPVTRTMRHLVRALVESLDGADS